MIETSITKVKIHEIVQDQIPEYINQENPNFVNFLQQYYHSQEFQGGVVDLADNLNEYKDLDFLSNENLTGFTSLTTYANANQKTLYLDSTKGLPQKWGLIKIDNEIITYTGIGTTSITGCVRGFSGIENNSKTNEPESLTFTRSGVGTHASETRVTNLSNVFLKEYLRKIKKQVLPGFSERKLNSKVNQSNFIRQAKDFYRSKGTEEAFKILFGSLYDEKVDMIQPSKFMIKPSDADYIVADIVLAEALTGNPIRLEGQSLIQGENSGSIFRVESSTIAGKQYYKIGISKGTQTSEYIQNSKTFITKSAGISTTILDVDSTIGFSTAGNLRFENRVLSYTDKNYTQFLGLTPLTSPCGIGSTVISGNVAYSYENGDLTKPVTMNILGVLQKFEGSGNNQQSGSQVNVKSLGIEQKDLRWSSWIYNTASRYEIKEIASITDPNQAIIPPPAVQVYKFDLIGEHVLYLNDEIEIISQDGVVTNATITNVPNSKTIELNSPRLDLNQTYFIRRKLKTNSGLTADVQNSYSDGSDVYVASNSFPHWNISPQKRIRTFTTVGFTTSSTTFTVTDHNYHDGELVVYNSTFGDKLDNLEENQAYYVKKIDDNTLALAYTPENVRRGQYITSVAVSDLTGITTHFLTPQNVFGSDLGAQKLLRKFPVPEFGGTKTKTVQGGVGLFANGVEIYSYKSTDKVFYGPLENVEVLNQGSGYDVINPPRLAVVQDGHTGIGASVVANMEGSITEIFVDTEGDDYQEDPTVRAVGGNDNISILKPKMKFVSHVVTFDSSSTGGVVNTAMDRLQFKAPHALKDGEEVIYNTGGSDPIGIGTTPGTLIDNASYFVVRLNEQEIHLSDSQDNALAGIGTIPLSGNGGGQHTFSTFNKRFKVDKILIENPGLFKNRYVTTQSTVGINSFTNSVSITNHGFESGDLIKYTAETATINGLTSGNEYYVVKISDDEFRVSISTSLTDYVKFNTAGSGEHIFQDPPISILLEGRQGITTANATATPVLRGSVASVYVTKSGNEFGSTVINDDFEPLIDTVVGTKAFLQPFIVNGRIDQIIIKYGGEQFFSTPDIIITGDGVGARAKAVVSNGQIVDITMIDKGAGYTQAKTTVAAKTPGNGAIYSSNIKNWTVNQVARYARSGDMLQDDGFYEVSKNTKLGNPYANYFVPRNLRDFFGDSGVEHSPILGYAYDGNPIYGPYAYKSNDGSGGLDYIRSSYTTIPRADGPPTTQYPEGFFVEDYQFVTGLGQLDRSNGRFAVTPEFPNGTYAYYTTVENSIDGNSGSPFFGVRKPTFPYVVGDFYSARVEPFNLALDSDQDLDPVKLNLIRNTDPHKTNNYEFISNSNRNSLTQAKILGIKNGSIDEIEIVESGDNYNMGDKIVFDNTDTKGFGAIGKVTELVGPTPKSLTSTITTVENIKFIFDGKTATGITTVPHNIPDNTFLTVGISTDDYKSLEGNYRVKVAEFSSGLSTSMLATGLTTSIQTFDDVSKFRIGDVLRINTEEFVVYGRDGLFNELDLIRAQNGTTGVAHTFGSPIVRLEHEFTFEPSKGIIIEPEVTQYFRGGGIGFNHDVGIGLTFGVGIGYTVSTLHFGERFIPTRTIWLPRHPFRDGEAVSYSPGAGSSITYQTDAMKRVNASFKRPLPPTVYLKVIDNNKVGVVTTLAGISSDLQQCMFDTNTGIGNTHYFTSQRSNVQGSTEKINVTVTTAENHTLRPNDIIDLRIVSAGTSSVVATYDSGNRYVSIGSSINPPINVITGDKLEFDLSSATLADLRLDFFLDKDYQKSFVGSGNSAIEITSVGVPGNALATKTVHFTEQVPDVLYYKFTTPNTSKIIEINDDIVDYSKIVVNQSKFNSRIGILTVTPNTFEYNLDTAPERVGYTTTSEIKYNTTSLNVTGPVGKVELTSGGASYVDTPLVSVASTTGTTASLKASGLGIGELGKTDIVEFGYDYPSDRTLKPQAAVPNILLLRDNFAVEKIGITSAGSNYLTPPNLILYNSKTNLVNPNTIFNAELEGSGVGKVKIIKSGGNLSRGDAQLLAVDNSNGVGIITATYSNPTVTLRLKTPLSGFGSMTFPFAVGDKVFVENTGVSTGNGYNSADYNYQYFTLTGVTTNPGTVNQAIISYDVPSDPGVHNYEPYGSVSNKNQLPQFDLTLSESQFINNEIVYVGDNEAKVITGDGKTKNTLRVDSLVGFNTGDSIVGKTSNGGGTIDDMEAYSGSFETGVSIERPYGWEKDTGKLNEFYQRIQDSDYYQNFSYSLKSLVGISSWSEPVDSLSHIGGFKKHSDLLIPSVPIGIGTAPTVKSVGSATTSVVLIDSSAKVYEKSGYDTVYELTDSTTSLSDQLIFSHSRFGDSLLCKSNRVLEIDDISPQFYSDPNILRAVEIDTWSSGNFSGIKYYAQVVLDTSLGISYNATQYCEFIVTHNNEQVILNQYSDLSDVFDLGEFTASLENGLVSVSFFPYNSSYTYDVTFFKESISNTVAFGQTSFAHVEKIGISSYFAPSGSPATTVIQDIDATKFKSGSIILVHNGINNREFEEYNWMVDGANNVVYTDYGNVGFGTTMGIFSIDASSNVVSYKYTPVAGIGVTIQTLSTLVGVATTVASVGGNIMSIEVGDTELNANRKVLTASGSPIAQVVSIKPYSNYTTVKYHVEVENTTDSKYSSFDMAVNAYEGNANFSKYNNLTNYVVPADKRRDILNTSVTLSGTNIVVEFTPKAGKAYVVRISELRIDKPDNVANDVILTL